MGKKQNTRDYGKNPIRYADGGLVVDDSPKDESRYGDDAADITDNTKSNQWQGRMLLGPPRTKNTPGYDTDTSSTHRKKYEK